MWILAQLLTEITRKPRQRVTVGIDFEWSKKSWTHNVFRLYELVFWRRYGIKAESTTYVDENNRTVIYCHSWESVFAYTETYIREFFLKLRYARIKVFIPVLMTPQGIPIYASPYRFLIAFDAFTNGTNTSSFSHTTTGSNRLLMAVDRNGLTDSTTSATYNSVSMNQDYKLQPPTDRWNYIFSLLNPASGSNTVAFTGGANRSIAFSYTGVNQSGQPEATNTGTNASATSLTVSVTTISDNAWLIGWGDTTNSATTAGTNTTRRGISAGTSALDSNAPQTPPGSFSLQITDPVSVGLGMGVESFAPVAAAGGSVTVPVLFRSLLGVGR